MRETRTAQISLFDTYSSHKFGDFLQSLSGQLDQYPEILTLLEQDLLRQGIQTTGRQGLSVESLFRCILLKQITQDSYDQLAFHLMDSPTYRAFARIPSHLCPRKSALSGNIRRIRPQTLEQIFNHLGLEMSKQGLTDTKVLRLDSSVVKSNIAPPTDSHLLADGVRVIGRLLAKSRDKTGIKLRLTDYRKAAKSLSMRIFYGKKPEKEALYPKLISIAKHVIKQSKRSETKIECQPDIAPNAQSWLSEIAHYRQLLERVIDQTERRIIQGEKIPPSEKIVSLFEPHTDIIIKGYRDIQYGHKINLATDANGLITVFRIESGNPADTDRYQPIIEQHKTLYGELPTTTIADGGYASMDNIRRGKELGVKQVAFHKKRGISVSAMGIKEKTLKRLRDFRAGIEGNISELKRAFGAGKALWKGEDGFNCFVWASVISYNLTRLVRMSSG